MNYVSKLNRRSFFIMAAAAGGGLALGLDLPFGYKKAAAQATTPEIGAWVVIKPDDTVVIRVVRSEMGQGTVTGLCQLVAEELELPRIAMGEPGQIHHHAGAAVNLLRVPGLDDLPNGVDELVDLECLGLFDASPMDVLRSRLERLRRHVEPVVPDR